MSTKMIGYWRVGLRQHELHLTGATVSRAATGDDAGTVITPLATALLMGAPSGRARVEVDAPLLVLAAPTYPRPT